LSKTEIRFYIGNKENVLVLRTNKVWNGLESPLQDLCMNVQLNIPLKYLKFGHLKKKIEICWD